MTKTVFLRLAASLALLSLAVAVGVGLSSPEGAAAARTLTIRMGDGEPGFAVNEFLPGDIRVNRGDTIHWTNPWFEPHTVTFGQPTGDPTVPTHPAGGIVDYNGTGFVSSGIRFGPTDEVIDIRFTTTGSFPYFCALHPNMTGVVVVVDSTDVVSQAQADAQGNAEYNSAILALKIEAANLAAVPTPTKALPGGATQYGVRVGGESFGGDAMQFFAPSLTIKAGDAVEFVNPNGAPHNVAFGPPQGDPFEFAGSDVSGGWNGTGGIQSPLLGAAFGPNTKWTVKFTKAGTYTYLCMLHADQGMTGTITVQEAPAPAQPSPTPKPPQTGTGAGSGSGTPLGAIALGTLVAIAGLGAVALRAAHSTARA